MVSHANRSTHSHRIRCHVAGKRQRARSDDQARHLEHEQPAPCAGRAAPFGCARPDRGGLRAPPEVPRPARRRRHRAAGGQWSEGRGPRVPAGSVRPVLLGALHRGSRHRQGHASRSRAALGSHLHGLCRPAGRVRCRQQARCPEPWRDPRRRTAARSAGAPRSSWRRTGSCSGCSASTSNPDATAAASRTRPTPTA